MIKNLRESYLRKYDLNSVVDLMLVVTLILSFVSSVDTAAWMTLIGKQDREFVQTLVTITGLLAFLNVYIETLGYRLIDKGLTLLIFLNMGVSLFAWIANNEMVMVVSIQIVFSLMYRVINHHRDYHINQLKEELGKSFDLRVFNSQQKVMGAVGMVMILPVVYLLESWSTMDLVFLSTISTLVLLQYTNWKLNQIHPIVEKEEEESE